MTSKKILLIATVLILGGCKINTNQIPTESIPYIPYTSATPSITPTIDVTLTPTETPATTSAVSEDNIVFKVGNIYGCSFTDTSNIVLDKKYFVTKIHTWYSWESSEKAVGYSLLKDKKEIASGNLERSDCDPYQKQWCGAIDKSFNRELEKGDYVLKLKNAHVCQNSQSDNNGFVQIYAK